MCYFVHVGTDIVLMFISQQLYSSWAKLYRIFRHYLYSIDFHWKKWKLIHNSLCSQCAIKSEKFTPCQIIDSFWITHIYCTLRIHILTDRSMYLEPMHDCVFFFITKFFKFIIYRLDFCFNFSICNNLKQLL